MDHEPIWLATAARRSVVKPWTLGRVFAEYRTAENLTEADIAKTLNCSVTTLHWLYLCRAPAGARFSQDVERIAERYALNPIELAGVIRAADALSALRTPSNENDGNGMLLAARDRESEEEPR